MADALLRSRHHPEIRERYNRIKSHRGHKKAIIAVCKMLLTAIWNILSKHEPYSANGYRQDYPTYEQKVLTKSQALDLLKRRGFIIQNIPLITV